MSDTVQIGDTGDLICGLKAAVTALECQYKMNLLEEQVHKKEQKPARQPPMYMMIPIEQKKNNNDNNACEDKTKRKRNKNYQKGPEECADSIASLECPRPTKRRRDECEETFSPTMRGGVLHTRCGCIHRDGLQDYCPLTECRGQPECMTKPWPTCPPGRYFRKRYPEIYPPAATDSISF